MRSKSREFFAAISSGRSPVSSEREPDELAAELLREARGNGGNRGEEGELMRRMAPRRRKVMELGPSPDGRLSELIVEMKYRVGGSKS